MDRPQIGLKKEEKKLLILEVFIWVIGILQLLIPDLVIPQIFLILEHFSKK